MKIYTIPQTHIAHVCSMTILTASIPAKANILVHAGEQLYGGEY